jgi:7-cyano-7-deazaguanine synthase
MECRETIRAKLPALSARYAERLGPDHVVDLKALGAISETALTRETEIAFAETGLPTTFVPGRNLIFLTFAAALAYRRDLKHIVLGVCETDYSGYPDCRDDTIKAMQVALASARPPARAAHAADVARQGPDLRAGARHRRQALLDLVIEDSHSCYLGDRTTRHDWGYGCGHCPACDLRAKGFAAYLAAPDDSGPFHDP